jgi:tetratricopeptide (TPR) repeat protein
MSRSGAVAIAIALILTQDTRIARANEQQERNVDEVALASQNKAIEKLQSLLKKYVGKRQEPTLLYKLAEVQAQASAMHFRIAHGKASRTKKAVDATAYNRSSQATINSLNSLIAKYPAYEEIAPAYALRGKSYEEIGNKAKATQDYLFLVGHYPEAAEVPSAYMALSEFAIEANDHPTAIKYLMNLEKRPEDPHYPFALYKLAWSHYNLKQIDQALGFAERQIAFYREHGKAEVETVDKGELNTSSDHALTENTLLDIPVFFFEGYETGGSKYSLSDALPYFRKMEKGSLLGKMSLRFAKLLRSHGHEADLNAWKKEFLSAESARPESLDIAMTVFENQLNKRRYEQVVETAQDFVALRAQHEKTENFAKAQKLILDTAEGLQTIIVKNKNATEVPVMTQHLAKLYETFTHAVAETDPRIPRVHYNLAETLFTIQDYGAATEHYRWVVDHARIAQSDTIVADALLKAVAARYEILRQKKLIAVELKAQAFTALNEKGEAPAETGKLDPLLAEWRDWIAAYRQTSKSAPEKSLNFAFESARAIYVQNRVRQAVDELQAIAGDFPKSEFAVPAASLIIDTWVTTADWLGTQKQAEKFLKQEAWKGSEFAKRLGVVASDAFYKQIEVASKAGRHEDVLEMADRFAKLYASSARVTDTLVLAGGSALSLGLKDRAMASFNQLISLSPGSENAGHAMLARAKILEESYQFADASLAYQGYLSLPKAVIDKTAGEKSSPLTLRKKILSLSWLAGDARELRRTAENKTVCEGEVSATCDKFKLLAAFMPGMSPADEATRLDAFEQARKATGEARVLYAALALENVQDLPFRDRHLVVRLLTDEWKNLDALSQLAILPRVSVTLPRVFELNRGSLKDVAPLRATEKYITHRIDMIREMENAATKAMGLPWTRVRASVLNEMASVYVSLGRDIAALPAPKDLSEAEAQAYEASIRKIVIPFEEKGQDMRLKAFEIASKLAIDPSAFKAIAEPFFAENPSQAKRLDSKVRAQGPMLDLKFVAAVAPEAPWDKVQKLLSKGPEAKPIVDLGVTVRLGWHQAIAARNWPRATFLAQELRERKLAAATELSAIKAVTLAASGAQGEAIAELEDAKKGFLALREPRDPKDPASIDPQAAAATHSFFVTMIDHFVKSCAKDKALEWLRDLPIAANQELSKDGQAVVAAAETYTQFVRAPASGKQAEAPAAKKTQAN